MADFGIICEFNPMHNGHIHLINEAKRRGADRVICVMSGNAVQRGELAIADKYTRARIAADNGADLVLELPYPYCSASAEFFARAGMNILSGICDNVIFGSECGDMALLKKAAEKASTAEFKSKVSERIANGEGAARAYFGELEKEGFVGLSSNDILGIEYIRAALENGYSMNFSTVKREGTEYNSTVLDKEVYPSATALRKLMENKGADMSSFNGYMPQKAVQILSDADKNGELTDMREIDAAILAFFRLHIGDDLKNIAECGGGLVNRICSLARESTSTEELFEKLKTKRYTDARLRRAMLFCMTGVTHSLLDKMPEYTLLLAANAKGREILAENRKRDTLNIITKPADIPECEQKTANEKLDAIFTLARKNKLSASESLKRMAYIKT